MYRPFNSDCYIDNNFYFNIDFHVHAFPAHSVVINEVARSGTAASADDEWIELYNTTGASINLSGWTLKSETNNSPSITLNGTIPPNGFYLLERSPDDNTISDITADQTYTGDLKNSVVSL